MALSVAQPEQSDLVHLCLQRRGAAVSPRHAPREQNKASVARLTHRYKPNPRGQASL